HFQLIDRSSELVGCLLETFSIAPGLGFGLAAFRTRSKSTPRQSSQNRQYFHVLCDRSRIIRCFFFGYRSHATKVRADQGHAGLTVINGLFWLGKLGRSRRDKRRAHGGSGGQKRKFLHVNSCVMKHKTLHKALAQESRRQL